MAIIKWKTGAIGDFENAADWVPGTVPTAGDDAQITSGVVFVTASETVHSLTTGQAATLTLTLGNFTMTAGTGTGVNAGTINVGNGRTLTVGTFPLPVSFVHNSGTLALDATTKNTSLTVNGTVGLDGGGNVKLSDQAGNRIFLTGGALLTNFDNTIAGSGTIGGASGTFVKLSNQANGVIDAVSQNGNALVLSTPNEGIFNAGLLEASGGGNLVLTGQEVDNTATGQIATDATSTVTLNGTTIVGGTLSSNGGVIETTLGSSNTFDGSKVGNPFRNAADVVVAGGGLLLRGIIDNMGTMTLDSAKLKIGAVQFEGGGTIALSDSKVTGVLIGKGKDATLLNVDNKITGSGAIDGSVALTNLAHGVIDATDPNIPLVLISHVITNAGLMEASAGGHLTIKGSKVDDSAGGTIQAVGAGSQVSLRNGAHIVGGTLKTVESGVIEVDGVARLDGSQASAPINNQAVVTIIDGNFLELDGIINNTGTLALDSLGNATGISVGAGGVTLLGGGQVTLTDQSSNVIGVANPVPTTLLNFDNTIAGAGTLGDPNLALTNAAKGAIEATGFNNPLIIATGANTVVNAGTLGAGPASTLEIDSALDNSGMLLAIGGTIVAQQVVTGAGGAAINTGGEIEFGAGATTNVSFGAGADGTLRLDLSNAYSGTVAGFAAGDTLDLADINFVNATIGFTENQANTGGTLHVTDGVHMANIALLGQFSASSFVAAFDNHGGTAITDTGLVTNGAPVIAASHA